MSEATKADLVIEEAATVDIEAWDDLKAYGGGRGGEKFFDRGLLLACMLTKEEVKALIGRRVEAEDAETGRKLVAIKTSDFLAVIDELMPPDLRDFGHIVAAIEESPPPIYQGPKQFFRGKTKQKAQWKRENHYGRKRK
jgi:hypothetical protein